jgi:hypothetical protein
MNAGVAARWQTAAFLLLNQKAALCRDAATRKASPRVSTTKSEKRPNSTF